MQTRDEVRYLKPIPDIWSDVLKLLSQNMTPGTFALIETGSTLVLLNETVAVIACCTPFFQNMVRQQKSPLQAAFQQVTGLRVAIEFVVDQNAKELEHTGTFADIRVEAPVAVPVSTNEPAPPSVSEDLPHAPVFNDTNEVGIKEESFEAGKDARAPRLRAKAARTGTPPATGRIRPAPRPPAAGRHPLDRTGLNPKYTFSTFVVGSNNRFCHSAAIAVSQSPGQTYNPLFVYGGVGLGKTHLMHAIGHAILEHSPNVQVRYVSCEKFTNDLINSIKDKTTGEFRKRYRHVDVLMIDDVQFIEGKESTQEEFFHTFNTLREAGKQIVLSSDRPPKAFSRLEERLRSRFEWGLTSDIQAPDYETRLAILRNKCEIDGVRVDDATLSHIATLFTTNIRELEGALIRVNAYTNLTGERVDQLSLHSLLTPNGTPQRKPTLTVDTVINSVAEYYKLEPALLKGSSRSADLTLPRHIAMHIAHELMNLSFPRIGQAFGNRKHTSALYANNKVKELLASDPTVAAAVSQIRRQLGH